MYSLSICDSSSSSDGDGSGSGGVMVLVVVVSQFCYCNMQETWHNDVKIAKSQNSFVKIE